MKKLLLLLFVCVSTSLFSQVDTLCIAGKKYPLQKIKANYAEEQYNTPIQLPVEYARFEKEVNVKYNTWCDTITEKYFDIDSNEITVKIWNFRNPCDTSLRIKPPYYHTLNNFVDTIYVNANSLNKITPYIKTKTGNHYFVAARILSLKNGNITEYKQTKNFTGTLFNFWDSYTQLTQAEIEDRKATTYILEHLYYTKQEATYYLSRQFIIRVTK